MKLKFVAVLTLACFGSAIPSPTTANDEPDSLQVKCEGINVKVVLEEGINDVTVPELCAYARRSAEELSKCGFRYDEKLTIEVVANLKHPSGFPVVGEFDGTGNCIKLTSPERCQLSDSNHPTLESIPSKQIFKSIVAHELAHAVYWKNADKKDLPAVAFEYLSYSFQLSVMSQRHRNIILDAFPRATPKDMSPFNFTYLAMNPLGFAANAYRHLQAQKKPCSFIDEILNGRIDFPDWDTYE